MNFEHFYNRHKNLKLKNDEILRKWKMQQLEEEQQLFESAARRLQGQASVPAGVGVSGATTTGSSQLMVIKERGASTFSYYVYNYDTNSVNGPSDTGISVEDYNFSSSNQYIIDQGGYLHRFYNGSNDYAMQFYTAGGNIVDTIYGNTGDLTINNFQGKYIVGWDYDGPVVWAFDGTKVLTDSTTFENVDNYGYVSSWDTTCSEGFLLYSTTDVGGGNTEHKLYLGTADAITPIFTETASQEIEYTYYSRYESDKILIRKWDSNTNYHLGFVVIDTTGAILQDVTLTAETYNDLSLDRFGTDKGWFVYYNSGDSGVDYSIYVYDFGADSIVTGTVSRSTYPSFNTYYSTRYSGNFSNYDFSENMLFHFYHTTGNYGYGLEEVDFSKFVGFFEDNVEFVMADFADDATMYISSIFFTPEVFLMPTDNGGAYSMLQFDSTGTFSYTSLGIDSGLQEDVNYNRLGDKIFFNFYNDDNGLYYLYMINSDASQYYLLDEEIQNFNTYFESDTIVVKNTDNNLAWYFNSVSTNWASTTAYNNYYDTYSHTTPTRTADGNVGGFSVNRIYYFNDQSNEDYSIADGGNDMYDYGNKIETNLSSDIPYTHTQITEGNGNSEALASYFPKDGAIVNSDSIFGVESSYFTNLYPGLFVLSATNVDITEFNIYGDIGADGNGLADNFTYTPTGFVGTYTAYIRKVWNAGDPSITQIMIVDTDGTGITHNPDLNNDSDNNYLSGLGSITKIHYLLLAKANGVQTTTSEVEGIINSYLTLVDDTSLSASLTALNANYTSVTSNLPPVDNPSNFGIYRKTSTSVVQIEIFQQLAMGKDVFAYWYYDSSRENKITVKLYSYSGTLLKKIDTQDESMENFTIAGNSVYLSTYTKYFDGDLYYIYNYNHLSPAGRYTATFTVGDETNLYWAINDWVWWD